MKNKCEHYTAKIKYLLNICAGNLKRFDVFLRYNTNLSTIKYKSYDLINVWKKFKKVQLFLSLDGFGDNAEYSRSGTDWPRVESNLEKIIEHDISFVISCTINIFNVFHLPDFIDKLLAMNISLRRLLISNLTFPKHYEVAMLSPELKIQLKEKYDNHLTTLDDENKSIISLKYNQIYYYLDMPISASAEKEFVKTTLRLDAFRYESITSTIPEYREWFTNLKNRYNL